MLLQRVLTALVLIPLVVAGVLKLSTPILAVMLAPVVLMGGFEWTRLAAIESLPGRSLYLVILASTMFGSALVLHSFPQWIFPGSAFIVLFWVLISVKLIRYRPAAAATSDRFWKIVMGPLVLVSAWVALLVVHGLYEDGPYLVLFLMILIWGADSCAYFAGRRWGRVKLAPQISPGKTREGVYGALIGAALCGASLHWLRPETGSLLVLTLLSVIIALFSVVGDLFESLLKRQAGLKDSGALLPGHGGVLDRIDSLTAAAPVFLFGLLLLEILR